MGLMSDILDGVGDLARTAGRTLDPVVPDEILPAVGQAIGYLDEPRQFMASVAGTGNYWQERLFHKAGLIGDERWNAVNQAYQEGGGRGVWEDVMIDKVDNPLARGVIDVLIDPLTYAGGIGVLGKANRLAGASRAATATNPVSKGLGLLQQGAGGIVEGAGALGRTPDVALEAGVRGINRGARAAAFSPVGRHTILPPARLTSKTVIQPTRDLMAAIANKTVKSTPIRKLFELTPEDEFRRNMVPLTNAVMTYLRGGDQGAGGLAGAAIGRNTLAGARADNMVRAAELRGRAYVSPIARDVYDEPVVIYKEGSPLFPTTRGDRPKPPKSAEDWRTTPGRGPNIPDRIAVQMAVAKRRGQKALTPGSPLDPRSPGIINMPTKQGDVQVIESIDEYKTIVNAAKKGLLDAADARGGWGGVAFALGDLQRIIDEQVASIPNMSRDLYSAIYSEVRRLAKEEGVNLPHERYAGLHPGGGYLQLHREGKKASKDEIADYARGMASGIMQALRTGGAATDFTPGGLFARDGESFRDLARRGDVGQNGLRLATLEEFRPWWINHFGDATDQEIAQFYEEGIDDLRKRMVKAAEGKYELAYAELSDEAAAPLASPTPDGVAPVYRKPSRPGGKPNAPQIFRQGLPLNIEESLPLIDEGMPGRDFYGDQILPLRDLFETNEDFVDFVRLFVVTSAHTNVRGNVTKALNAWIDWKLDRTPALSQAIREKFPNATDAEIEEFVQSLSYKDDRGEELLGIIPQEGFGEGRRGILDVVNERNTETPKLGSYEGGFVQEARDQNWWRAYEPDPSRPTPMGEQRRIQQLVQQGLRRSSSPVTDDMWHQAANFLALSPTPGDYISQQSMIQTLSDILWDEYHLTPHELQAVIWSATKGRFGYPISARGADESPMRLALSDMQEGRSFDKRTYLKDQSDKYDPGGPYIDWANFTQRGGVQRLRRILEETKGAAKTAADKAGKTDGQLILDADLRSVPAGTKGARTYDVFTANMLEPNQYPRVIPEVGTSGQRRQGILLVSADIPGGVGDAGQEALAFGLSRLKLQADQLSSREWGDVRYLVDARGRDAKVHLLYYPSEQIDIMKGGKKGVENQAWLDQLQMRVGRELDKLGPNATIPEKIAALDPKLEQMVRNNSQRAAYRTAPTVPGAEKTQTFAASVGRQAEELIQRMANDPEFYGDSFAFGPTGLVPVTEYPDYAVSLGSAGPGGIFKISDATPAAPGKKSMVQNKVSAFMRDMKDVTTGPNDDLVTFGVFKDGDNASFDINIAPRDAREAEIIGALTNQIAYYDARIGDSIPLQRGLRNSDSPFKTAKQVNDLIDLIVDSREQGVNLEALAKERGYTIAEPGRGDPLGIAGGQLVGKIDPNNPLRTAANIAGKQMPSDYEMANTIVDRLGDTPLGRFFNKARREVDEGAARGTEGYNKGLQFNFEEMFSDRPHWLGEEESNLLFGTTMADGSSVGDYVDELKDDLYYDHQILRDSGVTTISDKGKRVETGDPEVDAIIKKWEKLGIARTDRDLDEVVMDVTTRKLEEEAGFKPDGPKGWYGKAKTIWGEVALASPRYPAANLMTNIMDSMITGHWNFGTPVDAWRYAVADMKGTSIDDMANGTHYAEFMNRYGRGTDRTITAAGFKSNIGSTARTSQTRKALERFGLGKLARAVEAPMSLAQGIDVNAKAAMSEDVVESVFAEGIPELLGKLQRIADNAGLDTSGVDLLPSRDPSFIKTYYDNLGMPEGYSTRAAREVANLVNTAFGKARKEVDRVFLDYRKTNLDQMVAKVVPFHYWASRKVRFYAEEMARNPALLAGYYRAVRGIQNDEFQAGLSARQKGFLRMMGGPTGFTLLMNPDALLGVIKASALADTYTPEGETELGGLVRRMKKYGIGLYPWIDGAMNMLGMYGETFEPDMLGVRHRALVGSVMNWMRGEGVFGDANRNPGASPYADLNMEAREKLSNWASTFLPDWLSQPVNVQAGGSPGQSSLEQVIQFRIMAENPDLTNEELALIMSDPESPEYASAFQDAARAGVIGQMLSFSTPTSWRVDENTRDVNTAQREMIREEANSMGLQPWELTNTAADDEFRASYEDRTGHEFKVTDWETTGLKGEMARATPEARPMIVWENEYRAIANNLAPGVAETYYNILFGQQGPPGWRGDITMTDDATREMLADQWLASTGQAEAFAEMRAMQQAYRAQHPVFARFKDWQSRMRIVQTTYGSLSEFRREAVRTNPMARAYFADRLQFHQSQGLTNAEIEAKLDEDTMSSSAWFALNGQPETLYSPTLDPGMGDPSLQAAAPYDTSYYDPNALAPPPTDPMAAQQPAPLTAPDMSQMTGTDWSARLLARSRS